MHNTQGYRLPSLLGGLPQREGKIGGNGCFIDL